MMCGVIFWGRNFYQQARKQFIIPDVPECTDVCVCACVSGDYNILLFTSWKQWWPFKYEDTFQTSVCNHGSQLICIQPPLFMCVFYSIFTPKAEKMTCSATPATSSSEKSLTKSWRTGSPACFLMVSSEPSNNDLRRWAHAMWRIDWRKALEWWEAVLHTVLLVGSL